MSTFYTDLFGTLNNMGGSDQAGLETFAKNQNTDLVPSMVALEAGVESTFSGYTKKDVSLAFTLAGALSAGVESFDTQSMDTKDALVIEPHALGQSPVEAGTEGLVVVDPSKVQMFTVAHNISIGKSNQGLEEIMPIIMLACGVKGLQATIELEAIHESFIYDTVTNKSQLKKINALSLLRSGEIFDKFSNKVLPVVGPEANAVLNNVLESTVTLRGEEFVTAPILFDKDVNLLEITQTDGDIERGYNSDLTTISTKMNLDNVYLGDITDGDPANHWYVKVPLRNTAYSNWTYSTQDTGSDFSLSTTVRFKFDTNTFKVKALPGDPDEVIDPLATAAAGTTVELDALIQGSGNGENGMFNVLISSINFVNAYDVDGEPLTGVALTDLQTAFENTTGQGYDPDMALAQEEMRAKGIITTVSSKTTIYMVGQATPIVKYRSALKGACAPDKLESLLVSEAITYKAIVMNQALTAINGLVAQIKGSLTTGINGEEVLGFGIGRYLMKATLAENTFNPGVDVRNITSTSAIADIGGAIATKLINIINVMNATSGYSLAKSNYEASEKTEVYIWAHASLATYLGNLSELLSLGTNYVVKVLSHHLDVDGEPDTTIRVMFGTTNSNKTTELNPFQFGNIVISPSLVYDGIRTSGNSIVAGTYTIPQLLPVINHPVIGLLHIDNIAGMPQCCS
ncbi:MAG: hypothetical protein DRP93_01245 [Candidatus Neomarinimicrobiota bacterium]|nr:MAG: hypothetical protein DRP93_01245 [Candidatus Neomarinimicrobiota bacterium]